MLSLCLTLSIWQWSPQRSFSVYVKLNTYFTIFLKTVPFWVLLLTAISACREMRKQFNFSGLYKKKYFCSSEHNGAVRIEWSRTGVFEHRALAVFNRNPYTNFWKSHYPGFPNVCKIRLFWSYICTSKTEKERNMREQAGPPLRFFT